MELNPRKTRSRKIYTHKLGPNNMRSDKFGSEKASQIKQDLHKTRS